MLMIAGPILTFEDAPPKLHNFYNMEHGRKKNVFSITGSMLMIAGPILTFEDAPPKLHNF